VAAGPDRFLTSRSIPTALIWCGAAGAGYSPAGPEGQHGRRRSGKCGTRPDGSSGPQPKPMTARRRIACAALALWVTVGLSQPPAGAAGDSVAAARRRRAEAQARRARIAARIDAARASDRELERAVAALDANIRAQAALADAARQAAAVADAALADASSRLRRAEAAYTRLRAAVKARAVAAYVSPRATTLGPVLASRDFAEASRKREILDQVMGGNRDLLERLAVLRADVAAERERLAGAREAAARRRRLADARLVALRAARAEHARVKAQLEARIREFLAEADAVAAEEQRLAEFIRAHSAPVRASRSAEVPADGRVSAAGLIWPVRGKVTSEYGPRWGRMHEGIDIAAPAGTPIRAAQAGTVVFAGRMNGYGNVVIVDHGGGFATLYAHQSRLAVADGADVGRGDVVGYVGSTGHSTGPHLHFETRVNGTPRDPRRYLP
jgi:murein DD-endopeptidase MepM/ murein hydrolase activator NlpD